MRPHYRSTQDQHRRFEYHLLRPSGRPIPELDAVIPTFRVDGDLRLAMKPPVAATADGRQPRFPLGRE